ncbi:MAG: site-specific DNA-methyltransferase [Cyanobium sp. 49614_E6]|jgi:site-specific DNA-methyltransferase (adenine-specific)|nr:site-specific DNA-methyltransferase [Cyanobium sp. 49614_E6]
MDTPTTIHHGDALKVLKDIPDESVHLVLTDPPYFIDGFGEDWDNSSLQRKASRAGVVGSMPVGMKFDPKQGRNFQAFMEPVAEELIRILKPGGFAVIFSQARLYGRLAVAVEDAGFELRDMLGWVYEGQAKAFSQDHFVRRMRHLSAAERSLILSRLDGRKTPQLKPCIEPMVLAQKPRAGTFVENWLTHEVGLVDTKQTLDGRFPGNLMPCPKPGKSEKGDGNEHLTVKPVRLLEHLIKLFTVEGQTVLDPFLGSGSTAIAALNTNRQCVGIEIERTYVRIAEQRLLQAAAAPAQPQLAEVA